VNTVSPEPVTNREFTRVLASVLHRPAIFPVPALALRLAVGGFSEVLLGSQRVLPKVAQRAGYDFSYTSLAEALRAVVEHRPAHAPTPAKVS
jgi:NAD dependent epimerase/dehydratase family enzyme